MASDVTFLADTPHTLDADQPTSEIQVAKVGRFKDPRYGDFAITREDFTRWLTAFESVNRGRIPVDFDHASERGGSTEAAGWITALNVKGNELWGKVEWTAPGAEAVKDRRYLYISPAYRADVKDDTGKSRGPALTSVALTNKPFLRDMATVSLSQAAFATEQAAFVTGGLVSQQGVQVAPVTYTASTTGWPGTVQPQIALGADSQPAMTDIAKITSALKLDEGADESAILAAISALQTPEPTRTLDEQAQAEGKIVLDSGQVAQLQQDASEGKAAAQTLREMTFSNAFDKALDEGRVDAKPETRELHAKLYAVEPESTLKLLAQAQPIVSTTAKGSNGKGAADAPDGVDQDSYELDQRVLAHQREHKTDDYATALDAVLEGETV